MLSDQTGSYFSRVWKQRLDVDQRRQFVRLKEADGIKSN